MKYKIIAFVIGLICILSACQKHEHSFGEWKVTQQPTCLRAGIAERTCECGESETKEVPSCGHTPGDWEIVRENSCTEDGTKQLKCSACGEILQEETIEAGHSPSAWIIDVEASCVEGGHRHKVCLRCNDLLEDEDYPALGHAVSVDEGYEPTCTEDGLTDGSHCSVCGEILSEREIIKATGHQYFDGECAVCGQEETYGIGETWIVDDLWEFTIDSVSTHYLCNSLANKSDGYTDEQVILIKYHYKNLGYEGVIQKNLFLSNMDFDVYDEEMEVAAGYPCTHTKYPKAIKVGYSCSASVSYVLPHNSSTVTFVLSFDAVSTDYHEAKFILDLT